MRKGIKGAILLLAIGLFALPVFAEEYTEQNKSAVGIYGMGWNGRGTDTLAGLQFQHWFDNFGLQFTIGGFAREDTHFVYFEDTDKVEDEAYLNAYISTGLHLMYTVFSTNQEKLFYSRFYIWGLGGAAGISSYDDEFLVNAFAGLGIGSELVFWHRMSLPIEFGFTGSFPNHPSMSFSCAAGLRFRF